MSKVFSAPWTHRFQDECFLLGQTKCAGFFRPKGHVFAVFFLSLKTGAGDEAERPDIKENTGSLVSGGSGSRRLTRGWMVALLVPTAIDSRLCISFGGGRGSTKGLPAGRNDFV